VGNFVENESAVAVELRITSFADPGGGKVMCNFLSQSCHYLLVNSVFVQQSLDSSLWFCSSGLVELLEKEPIGEYVLFQLNTESVIFTTESHNNAQGGHCSFNSS